MFRTNNHTRQEMKNHFAGKYVKNPEQLPIGCKVTVFEKGTKGWWEHGDIYQRQDGTKVIDCCDGEYEFSEVEVYLDTRYSN